MKEILLDFDKVLDKTLDKNSESVNSFYESCNTTILSLQKLLEKDDLEFEERKYIIDKIIEMNKMISFLTESRFPRKRNYDFHTPDR